MKQFLESLIKSIVENPDAVEINEDQDQQGRQVADNKNVVADNVKAATNFMKAK